jgi:uncharacterized protein YfaT (DUF1175 family)
MQGVSPVAEGLMAGQAAGARHNGVAPMLITRASSLSRRWCVLAVQGLCWQQPPRWWLQQCMAVAGTWIDA